MEEKFLAALAANREKAANLGVRIRQVADMAQAKRTLSGSRTSDGFGELAAKGQLSLSLEALVVDKRFTALFTDEEANTALDRLLTLATASNKNKNTGMHLHPGILVFNLTCRKPLPGQRCCLRTDRTAPAEPRRGRSDRTRR